MSKGNRKRRRAAGLLPEPTKCIARTRDGTPCKASPMRGSNVCRMHGGSAPQVKRKALERLELGADRMAALLMQMAEDVTVPHAVRLAAMKDALDRAGLGAKFTVEVEATWQTIVTDILSDVPDDATGLKQPRYMTRQDTAKEIAERGDDIVDAEIVEDPKPGDEIYRQGEVFRYPNGERVRPHAAPDHA